MIFPLIIVFLFNSIHFQNAFKQFTQNPEVHQPPIPLHPVFELNLSDG